MTRVVHYTSAHPWTASRIFSKMCVHLARHGYDVHLVAIDPDADADRTFEQDDVHVHLLRRGSGGRVARALQSGHRVTGHARALDPDIMHFHDPELIMHSLRPGLGKAKIVFDAHEDFVAQTDAKEWARGLRNRGVKTLARSLQVAVSRRADTIVAATEGVARAYPADKRVVVRNVPILDEFRARAATPLVERERAACYVGGLSGGRGLIEMVRALERTEKVERLHLAGRFESAEIESEVRALPGWDRVDYHGYVDRSTVIDLLFRSRVGLVLLHPIPNYLESIPIKLLEYQAAGIPVLASDFPYWHQFVDAGRSGHFLDPFDLDAVAHHMDRAMDDDIATAFDRELSGRRSELPSWEAEVGELVRAYEA